MSERSPSYFKFLPAVTFATVIFAIVANSLSNIFPPGGMNVGEISNEIFKEVLIIPASYAFAIWGLIYLGLISYGLYQLSRPHPTDPLLSQLNICLIIASVVQSLWIWVFPLRWFALSGVLMVIILGALAWAYVQLGSDRQKKNRHRRWRVHYPFSVYFGWISVATLVNGACVLFAARWNGWGLGDSGWTLLLLAVATALGVVALVQRRDYVFSGVMVWALVAIAVKHRNTEILVSGGSLALGVLLTLVALALLWGDRRGWLTPDL